MDACIVPKVVRAPTLAAVVDGGFQPLPVVLEKWSGIL